MYMHFQKENVGICFQFQAHLRLKIWSHKFINACSDHIWQAWFIATNTNFHQYYTFIFSYYLGSLQQVDRPIGTVRKFYEMGQGTTRWRQHFHQWILCWNAGREQTMERRQRGWGCLRVPVTCPCRRRVSQMSRMSWSWTMSRVSPLSWTNLSPGNLSSVSYSWSMPNVSWMS